MGATGREIAVLRERLAKFQSEAIDNPGAPREDAALRALQALNLRMEIVTLLVAWKLGWGDLDKED